MKAFHNAVLSLLFAGLLTAPLFAQDISGTIEGSVLDPTGSSVIGAKVTITNTDRNQVLRRTATDSAGNYAVPLIPVGTYAIKVEMAGFKATTRTGIALHVNDDLKIDIRLE